MRPLFGLLRPALAALLFLLSGAEASENRLPFPLEVQDRMVDHRTFFAPVLPGEVLTIAMPDKDEGRSLSLVGETRGEVLEGPWSLGWKAPSEAGVYPLTVREEPSGETMVVNAFVMVPMEEVEDGMLRGYRIGSYPERPLRGLDAYEAPLGFIEVTPENRDTKISPRFTIGQFVCKQESSIPNKYVVLSPALIMKLEQALDLLGAKGIEADSLFIMSGYRTPFYNKAIGNVPNSRHVYGDAADVYVDFKPRDGDMDDLNGDGVVNKEDANYFYDLVQRFDVGNTEVSAQGGLGSYDRNAAHGPFLHIDTRGYPARWGR